MLGFKKTATAETDYGTGAHRDSRTGKGSFKWMPQDALFCVARIYEIGNNQRGVRNWENGIPIEDLVDSAIRHLSAYLAGDRSEPHLSQAAWNVLNALTMSIWVYFGYRPKSLNTLPNHRGPWKPGDEPMCPLSPMEIEWLRFRGLKEVPEEAQSHVRKGNKLEASNHLQKYGKSGVAHV